MSNNKKEELSSSLNSLHKSLELLDIKKFLIVSILYLLGKVYEGDLVKILGFSWGSLSTQLKMLKEKGFIDFRKVLTLKGPRTVIFLTDRGYKKYQEELKKVNILLRTLTSIREISD
nr:transcriptional regulator [Candidatus Baldrarchaeota archaeon]